MMLCKRVILSGATICKHFPTFPHTNPSFLWRDSLRIPRPPVSSKRQGAPSNYTTTMGRAALVNRTSERCRRKQGDGMRLAFFAQEKYSEMYLFVIAKIYTVYVFMYVHVDIRMYICIYLCLFRSCYIYDYMILYVCIGVVIGKYLDKYVCSCLYLHVNLNVYLF